MTHRERNTAVVVVLLIVVVIYGVFLTGQTARPPASVDTAQASELAPGEGAASTAQALAHYPAMQSEVSHARDALHFADKEMDLAFSYAAWEMKAHPKPVTKEAADDEKRLSEARTTQLADSLFLKTWTARSAGADAIRTGAADSVEAANVRLLIDSDEIDDAQEDLMRAGGDAKGRSDSLLATHKAASLRSDSTHVNVVLRDDAEGLVAIAQRFSAVREKELRMRQALADADSSARAFEAQHQALDAWVRDSSRSRHAASLADEKRMSMRQEARGIVEKRAVNERQLAAAYRAWLAELKAQQRVLAHSALGGVLGILAAILVWLFSDSVLRSAVSNVRMERRALHRLSVITRVSVRALAVLAVLIILFGTPNNLGTTLGLAGAGLTIALKDFIVSFVGWLVLMGRDGVRIGDLVEINGVTGEVVELGVFNTVLNETGNWTDAGHPTGRRVTFTNSYAIEGHYFNFSTSGQWLWDEVRIAMPAGRDSYRIMEELQAVVAEATGESAKEAEAEWRSSARPPVRGAVSAGPTTTIKPIMGGVELSVRYITHAAERYRLRATLYHAANKLLAGVPDRQARWRST